MTEKKGKVYLIGAGPGDPGLLTIKARACIEKADVVVYDYLASPALLKYASSGAEIIYVGKKGGDHTMTQEKISELLASKGREGLIVARLKGGDPFIFGRGAEEAEILIQNNVPFEVIPGVTSAIAAPAYAGIPLTHRDYTSSVSLITGHENPLKDETNINWKSLASSGSTLVFLMGVKNLPNITKKLTLNGMAPETPAALVRWGTTTKQECVSGTLENIVQRVEAAGLKAPAIIVIGKVVSLRDKMKWFESRPLFGKKIVVTRARAQASDFVSRLTELGADCIEIPTIRIVPPGDNSELENQVTRLDKYDWIVFTSVNGVKYFFKTLFKMNLDVRALGRLKCACIGPVTKLELLKYGIVCDVLPKTYRAESVVEAFKDLEIKGKKVLLPRAREARTILPRKLHEMGAEVNEVTTYVTELAYDKKKLLIDLLEKREIDLVTFTSSSTVKNFKSLLPSDGVETFLSQILTASIGPITSDTITSEGMTTHIEAETYTIDGLIDAIVNHFQENQ